MAYWRIRSVKAFDPAGTGRVVHAAWAIHARNADGSDKSVQAFQVYETDMLQPEWRRRRGGAGAQTWLKPYLDDEHLPDRIFLTAANVTVEYDSNE